MAKRFNHLHGAGSLYIIRKVKCSYSDDYRGILDLDATDRDDVEALLLKAEAVEIRPMGSEYASKNIDPDLPDNTASSIKQRCSIANLI